ncbi:hypothetical protein [Desulfonema magnum]|nr:hypothetical protein [Desulfonema magnum]
MERISRIIRRTFFITALTAAVICSFLSITLPVHGEQYQHAIVTTKDTGGLGGSYSWIQERKSGGSRLNEHNMTLTISDIRAASHYEYYFIMEGQGLNRVTCYDIQSLDNQVWQYAAYESDETGDTLPWDMITISERKAYLLRYGSNVAWIVNPLAENEAEFKTGELDFSVYDDGDGSPEMCCGVLVNGKAFIALRRVNSDGIPQTAYLAVIDTATDLPVDTEQDDAGLYGIPLSVKYPVSIQYLAETGAIYVLGSGTLLPQPDYTGGIEQIALDSYDTAIVLDDGDADLHPYGYFTAMALISATDGFFIGAASESDQTLYHFDPAAGAADAVVLNASSQNYMQNKQFAGLGGGTGLDKHDRLWISNVTNQEVNILITVPNQGLYSGDGSIAIPDDNDSRSMRPAQIVFCEEPEVTEEDEAEKPSSSGESGNFCFIGAVMP